MTGNKNKFLTKLASIIGKEITEADAEALLNDTEVTKAITTSGMELKGSENVKDVYNEEQHWHVPTKEELKVGPAQAAHGANAEREIHQYSDLTAQTGMAKMAEEFGRALGELTGVTKSQTEAINRQGDALASLAKSLTDSRVETSTDVTIDQAVATITEHAKSVLVQAELKLDEARGFAAKAASIKSAKTKKSIEAMGIKLVKAASELLEDVRDAVVFVGDDALTNAFNLAAIKAEDIDLIDDDAAVQKADDGDDDEDDKKKFGKKDDDDKDDDKEKAKKAVSDDNVVLTKAVWEEMQGKLDKALSGHGMLQTEVKGMFDLIQKTPKSDQPNPADLFSLMKSNPQSVLDTVGERIDSANLEGSEYATATNLFGKLAAVSSGNMDGAIVKKMIADAPLSVRTLFADAA